MHILKFKGYVDKSDKVNGEFIKFVLIINDSFNFSIKIKVHHIIVLKKTT